jgi:hypothetical protein
VRLQSVHLVDFKRFTDLAIEDLPSTAKLVVLAGPNGSGKSSLFDGLRTWAMARGAIGASFDHTYAQKVGRPVTTFWGEMVKLTFHDQLEEAAPSRVIYQRTAFRNEADFSIHDFAAVAPLLTAPRPARLIDNDVSVSDNYRRMIWQTVQGVYDDSLPGDMSRIEIRDRIIGDVREPLSRVFPDLTLLGVGTPGHQESMGGTFFFRKGEADGFLYKNLSAGEKAAFDLILDIVIKREAFNDTIWCIDEPEVHLNTRVQAVLLETLVDLLPDTCQLWIASHSLGFMSQATQRSKSKGDVAFLDMGGVDFDQPVVLRPQVPSRDFWTRTLDVALGDIATLVAPERIVLCEGRPARNAQDTNAAFDAGCYRAIFKDTYPETDFLSVGDSLDSGHDRLNFEGALKTLRIETAVIRLRDRDLLTDQEVSDFEALGTRVLGRRHIESYLYDDEVLTALCVAQNQPHKVAEVLEAKQDAIASRTAQGKDSDNIKDAAGLIYVETRKLLQLTNSGSDQRAFARDVLAPLITPRMAVYKELEKAIFGV